MTLESAVELIPLERLMPAEENARRTPATAEADLELRASIKAYGLLENLVVCEDGTNFRVVAGNRRYRALTELADTGEIAVNVPVPCLVIDRDAQHDEIMLAENMVRVAMHPADQVEAFSDLVKNGARVADVAARFGVSELTVHRRLRLAGVDPQIMDAYRAGEIDMACLTTYASTTDKGRQRQVYKALKQNPWNAAGPGTILRMLSEHRATLDRGIGAFVGVERYEEAGGTVTHDLFADPDAAESGVWFEDMELLRRLAMERLEAHAEELRKDGWKWVDAVLEENWDTYGRCDKLHGRISAAKRKTAGCVVSIAHNGDLKVSKGYVRPEDRPKAPRKRAATGAAKPIYTTKMRQDLASVRTGIVRATLADNFATAFDLVTFELACDTFELTRYRTTPLALSMERQKDTPLHRSSEDETFLAGSPGAAKLAAMREELELGWAEIDPDEKLPTDERVTRLWAAFMELGQWQKERIFSWCIARTLKDRLTPSLSQDHYEWPEFEDAIGRLEIDFASWRPTKELFWGSMRKGAMLQIAEDVLGEEVAARMKSYKTGELASTMEAFFRGEGECPMGLTEEQWAAAKAWSPPGFAPEPAAAESSDG